jgi:hypothetical protein
MHKAMLSTCLQNITMKLTLFISLPSPAIEIPSINAKAAWEKHSCKQKHRRADVMLVNI